MAQHTYIKGNHNITKNSSKTLKTKYNDPLTSTMGVREYDKKFKKKEYVQSSNKIPSQTKGGKPSKQYCHKKLKPKFSFTRALY